MHLFVLNEEVERLERQLSRLLGQSRVTALVELAWFVRQRDSAQALELIAEAQELLTRSDHSDLERQRLTARMRLIEAEIKLLFADLPGAEALATTSAHIFESIGDQQGLGDVHWLLASISLDRGEDDLTDAFLGRAIEDYAGLKDTECESAGLARRLVYAAFRDPVGTGQELQRAFPAEANHESGVMSWISTARANVAGLTNDPGESIKHDLAAYHAALASGQIRQALVAVNNAVESFTVLGDVDAALEWGEPALALARKTGWPASTGVCLMQMGDVLRLLGRYDDARSHLQEALVTMSALAGSRNYDQVLGNLGQLALDAGDFATSLDWFNQFEDRIKSHSDPDLLIKAWRGQAGALVHLGRSEEASAKANSALALARAQGSADAQVQILSVLAQMHLDASIAPPEGMVAPSAPLHYLQQALDIAASISGYGLPFEFLNQVAAAYAASNDYRRAYEYGLAANESRNKTRGEEAQRRALAMQIRQEIERARAETEHHRQLAATLRETASTLETLGTIGREITASLDAEAVFSALYRHVNELVDATFFAIFLIDEEHKFLKSTFAVEQGEPIQAPDVAVTNPNSNFAKCARTRQEILVDLELGSIKSNRIPGSIACQSLLYAPLVVGERLLGVMSAQSPKRFVYGEREQSIFRALCAYGAIALDNAAAYSVAENAQQRADHALKELRHTQAQLVDQNAQLERLAVTDQLTGLYNRLRLDRTLEEEHSRNMRYGTHFCVLLLDVDEFKSVNDTFGHQTGDEVLIGIAHTLQE